MHAAATAPAIHSGNYYTPGVERVLAKLSAMDIAVPQEALKPPKHQGLGEPLVQFSRLEHAILDWFEGRDYEQAQALIHYRPPRDEWQVIRILDDENCPSQVTPDMLCPTRAAALSAVVYACDADSVRIDGCRQDKEALIVTIGGKDTLRIESIDLEPFDCAVRNRVRTAFKGVRRIDSATFSRAARLPGFAGCFDDGPEFRALSTADGCLLFGFPSNWALAMRNALKQVGIAVKHSQAQELVAVFFGASNWHQLVRHQDEPNEGCEPVALAYDTPAGRQERYYRSPEEAIFGLGNVLKSYPEAVECTEFALTLDNRRVVFFGAKQREREAVVQAGAYLCPSCIECAGNDYWAPEIHGAPAFMEAAHLLLADVAKKPQHASSLGLLYDRADATGLLEAVLKRMGLPDGHLVYFGNLAAAVFHVPEPDGGPLLSALVHFYRLTDGNPKHIGGVAMYKAEVIVDEMGGAWRLTVLPEYGRENPIEIQSADAEPVRRFLELTQGDHLFTYGVPRVRTSGQPSRH